MPGAEVLAVGTSLVIGYVLGSLPLSALVGRAGSSTPDADAEPPAAPMAVWRVAGPGWGLLALVADFARGVLPVTLAAATFSSGASWAAGIGAMAGALWPAFGRLPGRDLGVLPAVVAGVLVALAPVVALAVGAIALAVLGVRRSLGRGPTTER